MLVFASSNRDLSSQTEFLEKNIKHTLTVVKEFERTLDTKFTAVNHYLTNCNTKNWLF